MAEEVVMIALSPTMEEGEIVQWNKSEGEEIKNGDVLCEVETDKATMDYESIYDGTLLKILKDSGNVAKIGDIIAVVGEKEEDISNILKKIESDDNSSEDESEELNQTKSQSKKKTGDLENHSKREDISIKVSPLARKIAEEKGIDLSQLEGSGPGGRIIKRDIENYDKDKMNESTYINSNEADKEVKISQKRKVIAKRLSESKFTAPHYYLKISVLVEDLLKSRQTLNSNLEDIKVSLNAFIIKITAEALKKHPEINSSWQNDKIIQFQSIDIGLAVAQDEGLITPVVRDCGNKGIIEIEKELKELITRAKENKLEESEYTNCSFTISNLGSYGIEEFTAIINPPGSAILAVGSIMKDIVINENEGFEIKKVMKLTLSCDHRVIDGINGANFLNDLKSFIEKPIKILY